MPIGPALLHRDGTLLASGLVRQFTIGAVVIGESENFSGGHEWLRDQGVEIVLLEDRDCARMLKTFIAERPELWHEDIGL